MAVTRVIGESESERRRRQAEENARQIQTQGIRRQAELQIKQAEKAGDKEKAAEAQKTIQAVKEYIKPSSYSVTVVGGTQRQIQEAQTGGIRIRGASGEYKDIVVTPEGTMSAEAAAPILREAEKRRTRAIEVQTGIAVAQRAAQLTGQDFGAEQAQQLGVTPKEYKSYATTIYQGSRPEDIRATRAGDIRIRGRSGYYENLIVTPEGIMSSPTASFLYPGITKAETRGAQIETGFKVSQRAAQITGQDWNLAYMQRLGIAPWEYKVTYETAAEKQQPPAIGQLFAYQESALTKITPPGFQQISAAEFKRQSEGMELSYNLLQAYQEKEARVGKIHEYWMEKGDWLTQPWAWFNPSARAPYSQRSEPGKASAMVIGGLVGSWQLIPSGGLLMFQKEYTRELIEQTGITTPQSRREYWLEPLTNPQKRETLLSLYDPRKAQGMVTYFTAATGAGVYAFSKVGSPIQIQKTEIPVTPGKIVESTVPSYPVGQAESYGAYKMYSATYKLTEASPPRFIGAWSPTEGATIFGKAWLGTPKPGVSVPAYMPQTLISTPAGESIVWQSNIGLTAEGKAWAPVTATDWWVQQKVFPLPEPFLTRQQAGVSIAQTIVSVKPRVSAEAYPRAGKPGEASGGYFKIEQHLNPEQQNIVQQWMREQEAEAYGTSAIRPEQTRFIQVRPGHDWDIYAAKLTKWSAPPAIDKLAAKLTQADVSGQVFQRSEFTIGATKATALPGAPLHDVDIHPWSLDYAPSEAYGVKFGQPTVRISGVETMAYGEHIARKGTSTLTFQPGGLLPEVERMKDIGDFIVSTEDILKYSQISASQKAQISTQLAAYKGTFEPDALASMIAQARGGTVTSFVPASVMPSPSLLTTSTSVGSLAVTSMGISTTVRPSIRAVVRSASVSVSPSRISISPSLSPSRIISSSLSVSRSISPSSLSVSVSPSLSLSLSPSVSRSVSASVSPSISPSVSPSVSPSISPSISRSPSISKTFIVPPPIPLPSFPSLGDVSGSMRGEAPRKRKTKLVPKYSPSLRALTMKIRAPRSFRPQQFTGTGFEVRPIPRRRK